MHSCAFVLKFYNMWLALSFQPSFLKFTTCQGKPAKEHIVSEDLFVPAKVLIEFIKNLVLLFMFGPSSFQFFHFFIFRAIGNYWKQLLKGMGEV